MKVFQIFNGLCHYDATNLYIDAETAAQFYSPETLWVDAPDHVFEGWGYDPTKEGDERFIQPTPPEGWLYDMETGTFYEEHTIAPSQRPTIEDRISALEETGSADAIWDELAAAYTEGVNSI